MKETYDVIAWGKVITHGKEYFLLSPKPYHSEMADGKMARSLWQSEGTLKWEVADANKSSGYLSDELDEDGHKVWWEVFQRSIIIFGSDALIEFYQDPKTVKVMYIIPEEDDGNQI